MLDSVPGTLMLTDCLEQCQANDSCSSINYETGLCVLFSSNADKLAGKISSFNNSFPICHKLLLYYFRRVLRTKQFSFLQHIPRMLLNASSLRKKFFFHFYLF